MHLLRDLACAACTHYFSFTAKHTPGRSNNAADALSPFRLQDFHRIAPHAKPYPCTIPTALLNRLVPHPNSSLLPPFDSRPRSVHTANLHNRPTHVPSVLFPCSHVGHLVQPPNGPSCCLIRGFAMSVVWLRFQL